MMGRLIDVAILALAGVFILFGLIYLVRGLLGRRRTGLYGVARQERRRIAAAQVMQGVGLLIVSLLLFGAFSFFQTREPTAIVAATESAPEPTAEITIAVRSIEPTATPLVESTATPTLVSIVVESTVTALPTVFETDVATAEPTTPIEPTAEPTATEPPFDAFVNVIGGLYLRDEPNGDVIILLENRLGVALVGGPVNEGGFSWRQVRAPDGTEGWVADEFLEILVSPDDS